MCYNAIYTRKINRISYSIISQCHTHREREVLRCVRRVINSVMRENDFCRIYSRHLKLVRARTTALHNNHCERCAQIIIWIFVDPISLIFFPRSPFLDVNAVIERVEWSGTQVNVGATFPSIKSYTCWIVHTPKNCEQIGAETLTWWWIRRSQTCLTNKMGIKRAQTEQK